MESEELTPTPPTTADPAHQALASNDIPISKPAQLPDPGKSVLWILAISVLYIFAAALYGVGYGIYGSVVGIPKEQLTEAITTHLSSIAGITNLYIIQFILLLPFILWISHFKKQPWQETLALKKTSLTTLAKWIGIWALYEVLSVLVGLIIEVPETPFIEMMRNGQNVASILMIVVLAPILEETLFRGYLFKAWRTSWLGEHGSILVISILFALIHAAQYHWFTLVQLFVLALILGYARKTTNSLVPAIAIHAANNITATIFLIYLD